MWTENVIYGVYKEESFNRWCNQFQVVSHGKTPYEWNYWHVWYPACCIEGNFDEKITWLNNTEIKKYMCKVGKKEYVFYKTFVIYLSEVLCIGEVSKWNVSIFYYSLYRNVSRAVFFFFIWERDPKLLMLQSILMNQ